MAVAQQYVARQSAGRGGPSGLADVLDVLLDKGLVIDAFVRVSLVGIELLTVDARIVVAGVDTYLHFAEAVNRLDLLRANSGETFGEMVGGGSSRDGNSARHQRQGDDSNAGRQLEGGDTQDDHATASASRTDNRDNDKGDSGNGGKGLLSRIVERGQAF